MPKCWECGKTIRNIESLLSHYKSHNIKATCHICKVIFRRLTSLTTHLDNAHSPPFCKKCQQSFSNVWELNRHAETHCMDSESFREAPNLNSTVIYQSQNGGNFSNKLTPQQSTNLVLRDSLSELRPQQRTEMKPGRPETPVNSVEYIVGEDDNDIDMDSDCGRAGDSTSSDSDNEDRKRSKHDPESDGGSSSTDCSSDSSKSPHSKNTPGLPSVNTSICASCGRGPFRSMKLHLLHCSGVRVKYQCSLCKELFLTEASLNEHYMPLYNCDVCGQVFSHLDSYCQHQCPKGSKSPLVLFCSESMPQACKICKSFFTNEKTLLNHVTRVHASVVSTKVCIIAKPGVPGTGAQSAINSQNVINQVINGKFRAGPISTVVKSSPLASASAPVRSGNNCVLGQSTNQPLSHFSAALSDPGITDTTPPTAAPISPPMPTIMAMFEHDSQDVALMKRMNTGWRYKASYPCRQCGAILRQPSLIISHRYLHRGHRSHQCQCGRAFKHQLHLLRHCVQHAEAISYICVSCGETFTGAKLLAEHLKGKTRKKARSKRKRKVKRKCRMPFTCDCGQLFFRPSAYIWHQLKNRKKTKRLKKPLK
ncbi:uncharacterized protein ABDE67_005809 [Symphorus nematophorus]